MSSNLSLFERYVDNMDTKDLVEYVYTNHFSGFKSMSQEEIKELYDFQQGEE